MVCVEPLDLMLRMTCPDVLLNTLWRRGWIGDGFDADPGNSDVFGDEIP